MLVICCNWKDCLCNYVNVFYTHLYEKCIGMSVKTMIYRLELWRSKEICIEDNGGCGRGVYEK